MPQPRERRVPTAPVDGVITVSDSARLMKREEFDALKTFVLPLLRAKGDPPPRIVEPGKGVGTSYFGNVRELLERTPGGTLVRGYKLFMYQLDPRMWRSLAWKAQFHVVVARAGESGKLLYECANKGRPGKEEYLPFIFVPSSRAHAEVSDEDMIANKFIMGGVVGGNSVFTDALVMDKKLRGRRFSVIATCPEACLAKRNIQVRTLPYFTEWFRLRNVEGDLQNLAEQFGMPCCNVGEEDAFDGENLNQLWERVQSNTEALINGMEGIKMELEARRDLFTGTTSLERVRLAFFAYYDQAKIKVDEIITERLKACQCSQKLK